MKEEVHPEGRNIIVQGDEGQHFYIIREGEVKFTKAGQAEEANERRGKGQYFGELALLSNDKRAVTVTACNSVTLLVITRDQFSRLLGSLSTMLADAGKSYS